jgi:hypothetical protein
MNFGRATVFSLAFLFLLFPVANGQGLDKRLINQNYANPSRVKDSIMALRLPLVQLPEKYRNRSLPSAVDNTQNNYWVGIKDQAMFYTCQQFSGVAYTFAYELNRLRNTPGWYWGNSYPPHYTWNFMNQGERYVGVDFLESFEAIKQQGHMTSDDYGTDTSTTHLGWISGYDKYYRGMFNHLKQVSAIMTNSTEGINTLKNYLYDHLDGSPVGGIVCFTTSSLSIWQMPILSAGTPEAGKSIVPFWYDEPNHGLTIVGYNDSIRFDLNNDGQYTNDLDITGDGIVDARDWEFGAFKVANSYGGWWEDNGYVYAMYRSFALNYEEGGIWNNRVYVVEADTAYHPLLTLKVNMNYNLRDRIRILAGVSRDTTSQMPEQVIDFPIFNFQGGEHVMKGWDQVSGAQSIEFGLDVTQLLNMVPSGAPARYFLAVEERDPDHSGNGAIQQASFISYVNGKHEYPVNGENVNIEDNEVTLVSAVAPVEKPSVQITTNTLPHVPPSQPYQVQLAAAGGRPPYSWALSEKYNSLPIPDTMPLISSTALTIAGTSPFASVALPFSFPFFGKSYDSIYVNYYGFITFEPLYLPGLYTNDEVMMLKMFASVAPAFAQQFTYQFNKNDNIFFKADSNRVIIRWKASVSKYVTTSTDDFALLLYPDGQIEFRYGTMDNQGFEQTCYSGISKGDGLNCDIKTHWNANELSGKSFRFLPMMMPEDLSLSSQGLLAVAQFDSTRMYDVNVQVMDAGKISASKTLLMASGLEITSVIAGEEDNRLKFGKTARMKLTVTNTGLKSLQNLVLKLSMTDTLMNITDSIYTVSSLQPAQTLTIPAAFSFALKHPLQDGFIVMSSLRAQSGQRVWEKKERYTVAAPNLVLGAPRLVDGFNDLLDPGEVADLVVSVKNSGTLPANNLEMKLLSYDTAVSVVSDPSFMIDRLDPLARPEIRYQVKASRHTAPGLEVPMQLLLIDSLGINQSVDFKLVVGKKAVALVNLSQSGASMHAMSAALDSLHIGYDTIKELPFDYEHYNSVFLLLGTGLTGWHTMTEYEATTLVPYLQKQGNLYMEGYLPWYYSSKTSLLPWFKYTSKKVPHYVYQAVKGIPSTFSDSMSFLYTSSLNYAMFSFEPESPAYSTLTDADTVSRNFEIVYDGSDYKTIGTFLGFSDLAGSGYPSSQLNLMKKYLDFFDVNYTGPYPFFHAASTRICNGRTLDFTDDSYDNITSWSWEFQGGTPAISHVANPSIIYDSIGKFDVRLTVSDGHNTKSILKKSYVTVDGCAGNEELASPPWFRVFPNPASGMVTVEFSREITTPSSLTLCDLSGHRMLERKFSPTTGGRTVTLDITGFRPGIYLLRILSGNDISTRKLIIY